MDVEKCSVAAVLAWTVSGGRPGDEPGIGMPAWTGIHVAGPGQVERRGRTVGRHHRDIAEEKPAVGLDVHGEVAAVGRPVEPDVVVAQRIVHGVGDDRDRLPGLAVENAHFGPVFQVRHMPAVGRHLRVRGGRAHVVGLPGTVDQPDLLEEGGRMEMTLVGIAQAAFEDRPLRLAFGRIEQSPPVRCKREVPLETGRAGDSSRGGEIERGDEDIAAQDEGDFPVAGREQKLGDLALQLGPDHAVAGVRREQCDRNRCRFFIGPCAGVVLGKDVELAVEAVGERSVRSHVEAAHRMPCVERHLGCAGLIVVECLVPNVQAARALGEKIETPAGSIPGGRMVVPGIAREPLVAAGVDVQ